MRKAVVGILAHVDAGKTTLSEALLFQSGAIRRLGRVDNRDAYLDTHTLERERGITIFSKQARLRAGELNVTLLDTPGHVDFSAETERTLQVLDCAVLVISGADGVQGHTRTLWRLLAAYGVPTFLFINKMDQEGTDKAALLRELKERLDAACVDFDPDQEPSVWQENVAVCDEALTERYLEGGAVTDQDAVRLIGKRRLFPCYFGSALRLAGVKELLWGLETYIPPRQYGANFGAKVYKIARDEQGNRLTYLKVTGGSLKVKTALAGPDGTEEKINQIRLYSGARFETAAEATAGEVCAVTGLSGTFPGQGLGAEKDSGLPHLEPVLTYQVLLPAGSDVHGILLKLRQLEEEDPQLHIVWNAQLGQIHVQLMGEVQLEILRSLIWERFGIGLEFGEGDIVYRETIAAPVTGVGHFEPLRHYAEVHLLMEPGAPGSGIVLQSAVSEDALERNWQRLILTHLAEREHPGVLTGAPVTDLVITLIAGRAHVKHTEGGDFRQATYRAVRQGLMKAQSVLLEPWYDFRLTLPTDAVGRAMTDIPRMNGTFSQPEAEGEFLVMEGSAPVSSMRGYAAEVVSYTRGRGQLSCTLKGYLPCHNQEEAVSAAGYDAEADTENPAGSVFCAHGAGFLVPWEQVEDYMHLHPELGGDAAEEPDPEKLAYPVRRQAEEGPLDMEELTAIFERTYGPMKKERIAERPVSPAKKPVGLSRPRKKEHTQEYLLVDGYNIIFAWPALKDLAKTNIAGARGKLMDLLCDYQGYKNCTLILVFDAYKVQGHAEEILRYHNIYVVYTREAETADQYIEKTAHAIGRSASVTVATSDGLEQVIILGQGCRRLSAAGLYEELKSVKRELREDYLDRGKKTGNTVFGNVDEQTAARIRALREE